EAAEMSFEEFFTANRRSWDERVAIHRRDETGFYAVANVLRGEDKLNAIEAQEIGDVTGKRIAHLQCHFGLDSLCLASRGASVVGLDFSPSAIGEARSLAARLGRDAVFVEGNVYEARKLLTGEFDMVYVTWGAINWLPDLTGWARQVTALLRRGGHLYLAEAHPAILCFDWIDGRIVPHYDWRTPADKPTASDLPFTYNGSSQELSHKRTYEWIHPLADIIGALRGAGLGLEWYHEHPALTWPLFPNMMCSADGLYRLPPEFPQLPLSFSLKAVK
ncbi:MAG TPA: class I SAM-dependent methyltransferase, partial [Aestuariivirgaceae bacterium]